MFLGIDIGTTALKAVLYNKKFEPIVSGLKEYELQAPSPEIAETDPEIYWDSLKEVIGKIKEKMGQTSLIIDAVAISSQGASFVILDKQGKPLRNTIVWLDNRSGKEAEQIGKEFGTGKVYEITGCPDLNPVWTATKLIWIKNNEPEIFKKIHKILLLEDYLIYRLTGEFFGNGSMYCETLLYDINKHSWWKEMLEFVGISENQLPDLISSGVRIGPVKESVSEELGIVCENVVSGGEDQACGCIGTGNIESGKIIENTGSAINIAVTSKKPLLDDKIKFPCLVHAVKDKYIILPWNKTAGMILKWFRDNFCMDYIDKASKEGLDSYVLMGEDAENIPPGSEGVTLLPFLDGSISPEMDENARGVFYGINLSTKREHFIRAIFESVAYMLRSNIEVIENANIKVSDIISSGGASKSDLWNQIKADVSGKKILTLKNEDSGCLGAAILAGYGSGFFNSIKEATDLIIKTSNTYEPDMKNHSIYNDHYDLYKEIYINLKSTFRKSAKLIMK